MIGIITCFVAAAITFLRARRSLGHGLVATFAVGFAYGLLRARVRDVGAHFVFDAALLGLYAAQFSAAPSEATLARSRIARAWTYLLAGWPLVCMVYSPFIPDAQPLMVQLVGLRAAVIMLPCLVLGARMTRDDLDTMAPWIAVLNLIALAFASLEYVFGIETFIPRSAVTDIVYLSQDVQGASGRFYRIPSTFLSSHVYGGTMAMSVPFVAHGLESGRRVRLLCWAGLGAAVVGTFLCGARLPVVMIAVSTVYVLGSLRMRASTILAVGITALGVAYLVLNLERFQRILTLGDTDMIEQRLGQSVNMSFVGILAEYPIGAGLASAFGTSIPYFLANAEGVHAQIGLESEYSRILLEEGVIGLALWLSFGVYAIFRRQGRSEASPTATMFMQALVLFSLLTGFIGTGMLLSIPSTPMLLLGLGVRLSSPVVARSRRALRHVVRPAQGPVRPHATVAPLAAQRVSR